MATKKKRKTIRTENRISKALTNNEIEKKINLALARADKAHRHINAYGKKGDDARKQAIENYFQAGMLYKQGGSRAKARKYINLAQRYDTGGNVPEIRKEMKELYQGRTLERLANNSLLQWQ